VAEALLLQEATANRAKTLDSTRHDNQDNADASNTTDDR
jgi:hypothetical protein